MPPGIMKVYGRWAKIPGISSTYAWGAAACQIGKNYIAMCSRMFCQAIKGSSSSDSHRHLKPGVGYFERVEVDFEPRCEDGTMPRACKLVQWYGDLKNATEKANRSIRFRVTESKEQLLRQGFVDVKEEIIRLPINGWPQDRHLKSLGTDYTAWMGYDDLVGMSLQPFTRIEGMSAESAKAFARDAALDILRVKYHGYNNL